MYSGVNIQYDDHILRPSEIAMGIYTQSYGPLATDFVNYVNNSIQICRHCWHLSTTQPPILPTAHQPSFSSPPPPRFSLTTVAAVVVSNLCAAHC